MKPEVSVNAIETAKAQKFPCRVVKFTSKRCFGVEVELGNAIQGEAIASAIAKSSADRGITVTRAYRHDFDNTNWHVKYDRSCGDIPGEYGWEIATFKASGVKALDEIGESLHNVKEAGANTNDRCALHVHVEVRDFSSLQMGVLVAHWVKSESIFRNMVPPHRDQVKNIYSRFLVDEPWMTEFADQRGISPALFWERCRPRHQDDPSRRKSLNLVNFALVHGRPTIEFRFPESSLNRQDAKCWVRTFVRFVDMCRTFAMPADMRQYSIADFMGTFGFSGRNPFVILSPGMRETKIWLCKRIIKNSRQPALVEEAKSIVDFASKVVDAGKQ